MLKRFVLFLVLSDCVSSLAHAQSVPLTSHPLRNLLTGNTASGKWDGKVYKQYFDVDGTTIIIKENDLKKIGKWKINDETEELSSKFSGDVDWQSWYIMEYSDDYYWVSKTTPPTKFKIEIGKNLK